MNTFAVEIRMSSGETYPVEMTPPVLRLLLQAVANDTASSWKLQEGDEEVLLSMQHIEAVAYPVGAATADLQ